VTVDQAGNMTITGTYSPSSDRTVKENIQPVSPRDVLEKVASLPVASWNFKADPAARHLGPMAQDFYAAFGVGADDKHIATVDADGVALAAIQGLNEKVEGRMKNEESLRRELEARLARKEAEMVELKQRLERLEQLVRQGAR